MFHSLDPSECYIPQMLLYKTFQLVNDMLFLNLLQASAFCFVFSSVQNFLNFLLVSQITDEKILRGKNRGKGNKDR
jgi:hypothetical protein